MHSLSFRSFSFVWLLSSASITCFAGVVVNQNVSPGATSWPGSPLVSTVSNPSSSSVAESFNSGNTSLGQTFTVTSDCTVQSISVYAGNGTGTGAGTNLTLQLYDLGIQTAPNPSPYTASIVGGNLFGGGAGLSVSYVTQSPGVLEFDFTGADQVALSSGHMYAFELGGGLNTMPAFWFRGVGDTYSGGAAYRNQSWINGSNARDFALAIYATANLNTNYPSVPYGIVYHVFTQPINGINPDGANPWSALLLSGGVLVGTTVNGGPQGAGTAFALYPDASSFNTFRSFAGAPDAGYPLGDLAGSGTLFFGTSLGGGSSGVGTVFVGQTNGSSSLIRSFLTVSADNATNSGGASPSGVLALSGNTLYGTASAGGAAANGTVFSVTTNGSAFSVLHDFGVLDSDVGTNVDGAVPWGGLVLSGNTLYGTASAGGAGGNGVVFSIDTSGANFTVLHSFTPLDAVNATNADGAMPFGGLVLSNSTLYGTTTAGGSGGSGTVFSIDTNGLGLTVLHQFAPPDPVSGTNSDGASPVANLTLSGGILYGTAPAGGIGAGGSVFSVDTTGTQFSTLYSFTALSNGTNLDGAMPVGGLVGSGGSLYGTTFGGGPGSAGTVFRLALPIPPAIITKIALNADGSATLFFLGGPDSTNVIQMTTDLASAAWQNISTNVADSGGAWQFTDPNTAPPGRFYRSYSR